MWILLRIRYSDISFIMALDFIAGCLGGCAGVLVGHPFDTVKVHLQTQDGKKPLYRGTWHCMSSIIKTESVNGLYRGVSSPMAGIAFINAIVFGVYGNVQRQFIDATSLTSHFVAGFTAGTVQSFVCSPMELAKTRMQLQSKWKLTSKNLISYRGPLDCLVKMYKSEGNRGVFRGLGCSILRDSPAFGVYFASYEFLCQKMETGNGISTPVMMVAGGVAGILSWVATYPVDLIKSRLQADGMNGVRKYSGIIDCALKSYRTEGIKVFTRGLGSTIIRAFPTNAATLTVVTWIFRLSSQQESLELRRDKHTPSILEKDIQRVTTCVDTYI